jgi:hypothetical protein
MDIPESLTEQAFRATNGEFAWTQAQALEVVPILAGRDVAILGGELWWVLGPAGDWSGMIPQENGPDAVYAWETHRLPDESWLAFVRRCASETLAAVKSLPRPGELPSNLPGRILYNLTWVSESDYDDYQPSSQS